MSKIALILFLLIIIIYILSYLQLNIQYFEASSISDTQLELALSFFDGLKLENNEFTIYDKPITILKSPPTNPVAPPSPPTNPVPPPPSPPTNPPPPPSPPTNPVARNTNFEVVTIKLIDQNGSTVNIPYRSSYKNIKIISSTYLKWKPENNDYFDITTDNKSVTIKKKESSTFDPAYNNHSFNISLEYD